ncbi:MAG TPA: DUF3857 domain-containing protein [Flavisolibacter sp.]
MRIACTLLLLAGFLTAAAQKQSPFAKFGKISVADLEKKQYEIDPAARAVVLSDIGHVSFEGNSEGWFASVFRRHRVVHILDKKAAGLAALEIALTTVGKDDERIDAFRLVTYHLRDGKITETKLDKASLVREPVDEHTAVYRFAAPAVEAGCIVELEYTVVSDFYRDVRPWFFQDAQMPVLWSEFRFALPQFFNYRFFPGGYHPTFITDRRELRSTFIMTEAKTSTLLTSADMERNRFEATVTEHRWVVKDAPPLKADVFVAAPAGNLARMEVQFLSHREPFDTDDLRLTWKQVINELNEDPGFGKMLSTFDVVMPQELNAALRGETTPAAKAKVVYEWLRDRMQCEDHNSIYALNPLRTVLKRNKGNVAEINLLLTGMLRLAGLDAHPVILGTRSSGKLHEEFPGLSLCNYVITRVLLDNKYIFLDASHRHMGFGKLVPDCYNGHARVVDAAASPVQLDPATISESSVVSLKIVSNGNKWTGKAVHTPGYMTSFVMRAAGREKAAADLFNRLQQTAGFDMIIQEGRIDSFSNYDLPVTIHYDMDLNHNNLDEVLLNPMMSYARKINPFVAAQRHQPVEFPYAQEETIEVSIEIPQGYRVRELPAPATLQLDGRGSGSFDYRVTNDGKTVSVFSRFVVSRTFFEPAAYASLKAFYAAVAAKHSEVIVLEKN